MQAGRTFITNGPALFITVDGLIPGMTLDSPQGSHKKLSGKISWQSHYPLNLIELIHNGNIAQAKEYPEGAYSGEWQFNLSADTDGWVAGRANGNARDSFDNAVYAHTSPIYIGAGISQESAAYFVRSIEDSLQAIKKSGRFTVDSQREEVVHLFEEGRKFYAKLAGSVLWRIYPKLSTKPQAEGKEF